MNPVGYALPQVAGMLSLAMVLNLWLDTLYINALALLVLLGIRFGTSLYFEVALIIALLGFIGTIALSRYVLRRDIIE